MNCVAHFRADFERLLLDRRTKPGDQGVRGSTSQRLNRRRKHAADEPAPTGMRSGDARPVAIAEQYGQAVGSEHGADLIGAERDAGIGGRSSLAAFAVRLGAMHVRAVHLIQPERLRRQMQSLADPPAILGDRRWIIADMRAEIQTGIGPGAHAARAQRGRCANMRRRGPVGFDPCRVHSD